VNFGAWSTIVMAAVIAWGILTVAASGRFPTWFEIVLGFIAVGAGLIAGTAATSTRIKGAVSWLIHLHEVVALAIMAAVLIALLATFPVLIWNEKKWTAPLTIAYVLIPSALLLGVIPGEFGATLTKAVLAVGDTLSRETWGWWR